MFQNCRSQDHMPTVKTFLIKKLKRYMDLRPTRKRGRIVDSFNIYINIVFFLYFAIAGYSWINIQYSSSVKRTGQTSVSKH